MKKNYAHEDSPKVGAEWRSLTEVERMDILVNSTNGMSKYEDVIAGEYLMDKHFKYPASFLRKKDNFLFHCN